MEPYFYAVHEKIIRDWMRSGSSSEDRERCYDRYVALNLVKTEIASVVRDGMVADARLSKNEH